VKQRKERKMKKMLRKANALFTCAALTYATLPTDVLANGTRVDQNNDFTSAALGIIQGVKQNAMQMQTPQMSQGQIQAMQSFQTFQQDAKNKLGADQMGANRHYIFNNCLVPPDKGLRPVGLCQSSAVPPEMMSGSMQIAQDYINMYDKHLRAQNTAGATGEQCIRNSLKSLTDQANTLLADFDKMFADYEAQRKEIENQQQVNLKKLSDTYATLNGTKGRASQDVKNMDFRKMFPKECTDIMGSGKLNGLGKSGGVLGIRDDLSSTDEKASNFRGKSLSNVKSQIQKDKKILQDKIKKNGMSALSSNTLLTGVQFKGVFTKALQDQVAPMNEDIQRANKILSELGVSDSIPSLADPSFEIKMNTVLNKAQNSYKDEFVLDCMRGQNAAAYSTPLTSIIGDFEHRVAQNKGTTIDNFKKDAINAISNSSTISTLEGEMSKLSNEQIKVSVRNENNQKVSKTISQYFADIKQECISIYNGDLKPAGDAGKLENYKQQSEQARQQLAAVKDSMDKMVVSKNGAGQQGSIEALVDDLINNCGGDVVEAEQCSGKGVYNKSAPSFCLKRATTCSNLVKACNDQAEQYVQKKTQEMNQIADQYNAQMKVLEDNANAMTAAMNKRVEDMAKSLHNSLFPSSIPPEIKALYGIPTFSGLQTSPKVQAINLKATDKVFPGLFLKGGGNKMGDIGKLLQGNVQDIKKMFSEYVNDQVQYAENIIDGNLDQWKSEKEKWEDFRNDCREAIAGMQKNAMEKQQQMAEQQQELDGKRLQFCQKYAAMAAAPGCDGDFSPEKLYSEAIEISSHLGQDVFGALDQYRNVCLQSNNEGNDDDSSSSNFIDDACQSNPSEIIEKYIDAVIAELPQEFKESEDSIKSYMNGEDVDPKEIHENLTQNPIFTKMRSVRKLTKYNAHGKTIDDFTAEQKKLIEQNGIEIPVVEDSKNFCQDYNSYASYRRISACIGKTEESSFNSCIEDKDEDFGLEKANQNSKIRSIRNALKALAVSGKKDAWSEIGEKTGGTSCAHIAGGRGFNGGSIFEQLGQMDSIGAGQNPFGTFR
jgi:hypothetical protein